MGTAALLRLLDIHTPPLSGSRAYRFALVVSLLALLAVVLLQWGTGVIILTPALFAVLVVTWYAGLGPGLVSFLLVASAAPVFMALPIGWHYSGVQYAASIAVATPLAVLSAVLLHEGRNSMTVARRSEQRFEAFMGHLPGSAWMKDVHGRYVYANAESLRILKLSREQLYGKTDAQLFPAGLAGQLHDPDALPIAKRDVVAAVESFTHDDGDHDYLIVRFPILDEAGQPEFIGAVGIDITDRARAERQFAERTAQLQLVIDQVPAFVAYVDRDHRFVTANRPLAQWYSLPASEMRGRRIEDLDPPETLQRTAPYIEQALGGEAVQFEIDAAPAPGVARRWFEARFTPDVAEDGSVAGFSSLILDITDRKEAESERGLLARLTDLLNRTLNTEETAQALVSALVPGFADGAAIYFAHADALRGVTRPDTERVASSFADYRVDQEARRGVAEVLRSGLPEFYRESPADLPEPTPVEESGPRERSARHRRASTMLVPLRVHDRVAAVLTAWTDESGRTCQQHDFELFQEVARRAERALEHSLLYEESLHIAEELRVANNAKDEFLGTVSHELRTPITVVLGNASLLATRHRQMDEPTLAASLNDLLGQAERLHRVVENMLILTRLETGTADTEPIAISQSISRIIAEAQRQQSGRVIRLESADWGLFAIAAESYVHQVMLNYLTNAMRFSPADRPIEVSVQQAGENIEVRVLDSGIGLAEEDLEALFTPFYRSSRVPEDMRGMGIGLSVTRRLIEALGGQVWARRREQGGAEFGFSLPSASDGEGALELSPIATDLGPPVGHEDSADVPEPS
ncbi:MAG: PAS domain-containing protein [Dehalococcoidia bacterium]